MYLNKIMNDKINREKFSLDNKTDYNRENSYYSVKQSLSRVL